MIFAPLSSTAFRSARCAHRKSGGSAPRVLRGMVHHHHGAKQRQSKVLIGVSAATIRLADPRRLRRGNRRPLAALPHLVPGHPPILLKAKLCAKRRRRAFRLLQDGRRRLLSGMACHDPDPVLRGRGTGNGAELRVEKFRGAQGSGQPYTCSILRPRGLTGELKWHSSVMVPTHLLGLRHAAVDARQPDHVMAARAAWMQALEEWILLRARPGPPGRVPLRAGVYASQLGSWDSTKLTARRSIRRPSTASDPITIFPTAGGGS